MSNFDVPATFVPPQIAEIWNEEPSPVLRPRCVAGMRNGVEVRAPWSDLPFDMVDAGGVRYFAFADGDNRAPGTPLGATGPLGCFAFADPAVLRVGDPVRVDGHLVGYIGGFAGRCVAISSWHGFCGGELEASPAMLLEIGGTPA